MRVLLFALLITISLGCAGSAYSQGATSLAQLNGTVLDPEGAAVEGALISLRELNTNQTYSATTNGDGYYLAPTLPPGKYELLIALSGFAKFIQTGITLSVGQAATVNVSLKLGEVTEHVIVMTDTPAMEPTRTEISQVIEANQIESLPVSGRLFTDFALLTPGVAKGRTSLGTTFTEFEITQISFGGMRSFSNLITVDGADFINAGTGVQRAMPSSGGRAGISRGQQQFWRRIRPGDGWNCQRSNQIGRQQLAWLGI